MMSLYRCLGVALLAVLAAAGSVWAVETVTAEVAVKTDVAPVRHVVTDTPQVEERFTGVLEPYVEYGAVIVMETGDTFEMELYPEVAPNHVANFISLSRQGFYDGVTFHRVIPNFVAQGGDPTGTGRGGPGYNVPAEFSSIPHERGIVSMARAFEPNSAGSQFFICYQRLPFLDGKYTVFGKVISGMDVVDAITPRDPEQNPTFLGDRIRTIKIKESRLPGPRDLEAEYPGITRSSSHTEKTEPVTTQPVK